MFIAQAGVSFSALVLLHKHTHNCSPFPLSASHPGSVATTPVGPVLDSAGFLHPGTTTNLPVTICHESDGKKNEIWGGGGGGEERERG